MKAMVVFESVYGNTAAVGRRIAETIRARGFEVAEGAVADLHPDQGARVDLLVVGGPTHAHGMSRTSTRKVGAEDKKNAYPTPSVIPGLREWMDLLPTGSRIASAAFDTRFDKPMFLTGSAAKGIAKRLREHGYLQVAPPRSFFVTTENALVEGALPEAERWASSLVDAVRPSEAARAS
jgi:hypothetical protein